MDSVRNIVRKTREEEVVSSLTDTIEKLASEGFSVEFGHIGKKTTYAMIYNQDHSLEYVGYTFIRNVKYYNANTGKMRALSQAMARKEALGADQ